MTVPDILKNDLIKPTPSLNKGTRAAFPGMGLYDDGETETHSVSLNGKVYEWTDETADSVPEEARAIYQRSVEANA